MPRLNSYILPLLLCLVASAAHAQDDYDFSDTPVGTDSTGESGEGGDDFVFDTPLGADDVTPGEPANNGGGSSAAPSFLQSDGGEPAFDKVERKPLTAAEREALRAAENERVWVLQRRPFLKTGRFEMSPMVSYNVNDPLISYATIASDFNYFLDEKMAIGLRSSYTLNQETSSFDDLLQDYSVFPKISRPLWSTSAHFQYTPLYGKLAAFSSWIFPWELYTRAGAGWLQTFLAGHVFVTAGAGQRFFMNRWLTINIDVDYQIFQETFSPTESVLLSNLTVGVGVSLYLPFDFEYRELR
jgi:outer membrane beta-barrel protein